MYWYEKHFQLTSNKTKLFNKWFHIWGSRGSSARSLAPATGSKNQSLLIPNLLKSSREFVFIKLYADCKQNIPTKTHTCRSIFTKTTLSLDLGCFYVTWQKHICLKQITNSENQLKQTRLKDQHISQICLPQESFADKGDKFFMKGRWLI